VKGQRTTDDGRGARQRKAFGGNWTITSAGWSMRQPKLRASDREKRDSAKTNTDMMVPFLGFLTFPQGLLLKPLTVAWRRAVKCGM